MSSERENSSPVVVIATFRPKLGAEEEVMDAFRRFLPLVHDERGCELYAIHAAPDATIRMIEKWATRADLDEHSTGIVAAQMRAAIEPYLRSSAEVTVLEPLLAGLGSAAAL